MSDFSNSYGVVATDFGISAYDSSSQTYFFLGMNDTLQAFVGSYGLASK
jgi:hypothetical protein